MGVTTVRTESLEGVTRVVLDNPPLNILTRRMLAELREAIARVAADESMRAVVLSAEGKHFSAGADVREHLPPEYGELIPEFLATIEALVECDLPVIAAVRGRCLGAGFELVQAADLVIAGESATLGQPEIRLGVLPPAACALLPRRCRWGTAVAVVLGGEPLTAVEAQAAGLVYRVVPDDAVDSAAGELGARMARHSGTVIRLGKRALRDAAEVSLADGLALAGETYVGRLMETQDAVEGLRAFGEKRQPEWRHR